MLLVVEECVWRVVRTTLSIESYCGQEQIPPQQKIVQIVSNTRQQSMSVEAYLVAASQWGVPASVLS